MKEDVQDSLENAITGLGGAGDKSRAIKVTAGKELSFADLEELYVSSAITAKVVEDLPYECTRRFAEVLVSQPGSDQVAHPFRAELQRLNVPMRMREAHVWARLYGGGGIVMGIDDGMQPNEPVNMTAIKGIRYLRVATAQELQAIRYIADPMSEHVGRPEIYSFTPQDGTSGFVPQLHHTRVLRFEGRLAPPARRSSLMGWGVPVMQKVWDAMAGYEMGERGLSILIQEYEIGVLRIKGLSQLITGPDRAAFTKRMTNINLGKSMVRAMVLDADGESYERSTASASGLADIMDVFARSLCMAADMPATRLFGEAPAGLSTDNESGTRTWNSLVEATQQQVYEGPILRICELLRVAGVVKLPDEAALQVKWPSLSDTSPETASKVRLTDAQADEIHWRIGAIDEIEIGTSAYKGGYSSERRTMSREERDRAIAERGAVGA